LYRFSTCPWLNIFALASDMAAQSKIHQRDQYAESLHPVCRIV
jgi:hypothetical protein